jgi:hypothetical protein
VWQPAAAPGRSSYTASPVLTWPEKAPEDADDYTLDLTRWLADDGDRIVSASLAIRPFGRDEDLGAAWLTILGGGKLVAMLSGGLPGVTYAARITVASASGRKQTFILHLYVNGDTDAAGPIEPPQALLTTLALTDAAGNWLTAGPGSGPLLATLSAAEAAQAGAPALNIAPNAIATGQAVVLTTEDGRLLLFA